MFQRLWIAFLSLITVILPSFALLGKESDRSIVTDEPTTKKGRPVGALEYVAKVAATDGQHLALTMHKLNSGFDPPRPFFIWAIGSSYTNMLGNGEFWKQEIPKRFPKIAAVRYEKMVGNSCPWQYLQGWARHLIVPDQPDLVLIYTLGEPSDLEKLIVEIRTQTTADIIVPSIHWRAVDEGMWGNSENSPQQDVAAIRAICQKHQVEFVDNRRDWGEYLKANNLPINALLKDAVHQSDYGAHIINTNIFAHFQTKAPSNFDPTARERRILVNANADGILKATITGTRVDIDAEKSPDGGRYRVLIDGKPGNEVNAFLMSYVQPDPKNVKEGKGANPRDQSPHGITLGKNVLPQSWTIMMTNDSGEYELTGSVTGTDGNGNAFQSFTSNSGQIEINPNLWRRAEKNRTGDRFTFEVRRGVSEEINLTGEKSRVTIRLAQALANGSHTVELIPFAPGATRTVTFQVYQPAIEP